jgi:hypothetical protein
MRLMTGSTLSLGVRRMSIFELFRHPCVAFEADARGTLIEQPGHIRGMRIMAGQSLSFFNRDMHHTLAVFIGHFGVA